MSSIAFLGTGLLGAAFAEAAARRGDSVTVWNRSPAKARALEAFGIRVAATPAEAVKGAQRVHLILRDDAVVEDVLAQARPGLSADAVVVDHTTTLPALTGARLQRLNAEGLRYLHAPVFMGPAAARSAEGSMLVSGPKSVFDAVQPELARMTGKLMHLGERADQAAVHKLMGNALIIGLGGLVADVLSIAGASGIGGDEAMGLMGLLDLNAMARRSATAMVRHDYVPTFELTMARKDLGLMIQAAAGKPMAALPGVAARMDSLIAAGHGAKGSGILGVDAI